MSNRRSLDDERRSNWLPKRPSSDLGPLFGEPMADIRMPVPVAPGSSTSEEAAEAMTDDKRRRELWRVLTWFAAQSEPRTTHDMAAVLYPDTGTGSACPRVNELVFRGYLERCGRVGKRSTLRCTYKGYVALQKHGEAA